MRRVIRGVDKFTIRSGHPFIVECNHESGTAANIMSIGQTGGGDRVRDARDPAPTGVTKQEACVVAANIIQYHTEQTENVRANGLRMLTPRELYNAMGFPPDYIIDRDYLGNEYGKTKQVARCGNAVCPPMATALVRANLPEWCSRTITTMEELEKAVTA